MFRHHFSKNELIHIDQGNQYCSADFKQLLLQYGLRQSMSRRGTALIMRLLRVFSIHSKHILFMTFTTKRGNC
ncbi:hypothetical protein [uncultured Gilliamella sp.]|uniref:hypothetical protein n=1 Tax=uncultured Gilliamella sp. TaxID=1193505 RepID=UPI00345DD88A